MKRVDKKVVIIGAGIAGLTAGIYARKAGFDTEIYEKHSIPGGECTGWDRSGYHIDNCIHWMMGTNEGSDLYELWKCVGAVGNGIQIMTQDQMYTSERNGQKITLWKDIERTRKELIALSPEDELAINALMDDCIAVEHLMIPAKKPPEMLGLLDVPKLMKESSVALKIMKKYEGIDTKDLMDRFHHPLIQCMISDFCTRESLAQSFIMAYGNFVSGDGGIPRGSSRAMALRMRDRFLQMGGKLYLNSSVEKIAFEGEKATQIVLKDNRSVTADYIVCACDADYTFHHLLDESHMDDLLKEVYENPEDYVIYSMFQVAYAIDSPVDAIGTELMMDVPELSTKKWMNNRMTVKTYAYEPTFAPEGKQILQVLYGGTTEGYDYWKELRKAPEIYREKKEELAQKIMKIIEERFPEYAGKMSILDVWTPVTYERYCNAYRGYNQAFVPTKRSRKNPYPSAWVKNTENVILATQWQAAPGGLPGAATAGKYAIQRICNKEKMPIVNS